MKRWVNGEGARFGLDDAGWSPHDEFAADAFADPEEAPAAVTHFC